MSRKKKIVVPTEQEVAQYAGDSGSGQEAASPPAAGGDEASSGAEAPEAAAAPVESRPEAEEWKEKFLRAKADLANYQRRAEKERADGQRHANARLVQALLPVLDDLERVICPGSAQTSDVEGVVNGVKLTLGNFRCVNCLIHGVEYAPLPGIPTIRGDFHGYLDLLLNTSAFGQDLFYNFLNDRADIVLI